MPTRRAILIESLGRAGREDVGNSAERTGRVRGCGEGGHRTDHLFFMDFSISVTVHGWEAGGKRSPVCSVCQRLARPIVPSALATFSPPPRVRFRFTSGLPQLIMNKPPSGGIPESRLINVTTVCVLNVRTLKIKQKSHGMPHSSLTFTFIMFCFCFFILLCTDGKTSLS